MLCQSLDLCNLLDLCGDWEGFSVCIDVDVGMGVIRNSERENAFLMPLIL